MRFGLTIVCISFTWSVATCPAGEPERPNRKAEPVVEAALREASDLVLKQEKEEHYWCDGVLLQIANVQIRAGDYDGALRSIRGSGYDFGRNAGLANLAEAVARDGKRERAFEILRYQNSDGSWEDGVQLRWIEHLISSGDLSRADEAIKQLNSERSRARGLRKLAVAYAKSGDAERAAGRFTLALDAAVVLKGEFDRAKAIWATAESQLSVGKADAAKATLRRLVERVEFKDQWAKVAALRESAVLAAKANDERTAHSLFRQAMEAQNAVDGMNKINAINLIAIAQAGVGYIDDALKAASMITHSEMDFTQDGEREEALYAIAVAQLKANDAAGAVRTALSIKYFVQYRDDSLHKIVDHQIAKRDLKTALATAEKADNPSRKATAILKVAIAHAKSGDRKIAAEIAAKIELAQRDRDSLPEYFGKERFDYRVQRSWGVCYDAGLAFTMTSHRKSIERAAETAAAAMELAQSLGLKPAQSYAILFDECHEEVIRALARTNAALGDTSEALAWAKKIGSSVKVKSNEDNDARRAVQQRIYALIGVAEGILDRPS